MLLPKPLFRAPTASGSGDFMVARLLCVLLLIAPALGQSASNQLKMVIVLSRHGVRSNLNPMSAYAKDAWPDNQKDWQADCCGDLTPAGEKLVYLLGAYYRSHYAKAGLLPATCPANDVYIWADNEERTILTGRQLARGLAGGLPGCEVRVQSRTYNPPGCSTSQNDSSCHRGKAGPADLWFHPLSNAMPDPAKLQQVADGINSRYDQLRAKYLNQLHALQDTLGCCKCPGLQCTLLSLPHKASLEDDKKSVKWKGAFNVGSTASEIFLLEYAHGMPCDKVGWGRVGFDSPDCPGHDQNFRLMQEIHTAYFQQMQRAPYIAQIQGSNLTNQVLTRLQEAVKSDSPPQKLVIFSGHDTNIANVAAMLNLHWKLPDLPDDDTPPAGALVFELYSGPEKGKHFVRMRYLHQTLRQLRTRAALTEEHPPNWVDLTMSPCGTDCDFQKFEEILQKAIDNKFVIPNPADK
jgi:4-phytase / acid phosphatase